MPEAVRGCRLRALLAVPGAVPVLAASLLARVPAGMVPFALVLTVRHQGGGYGIAGGVAASYSAALGVGAPLLGRAVDRRGARTVLLPVALVFAAALAVEAFLPVAGAPIALLFVGAVASGAMFPPVAATLRAAWPRLLPLRDHVRDALALDAIVQELNFVIGPLLVSVLAAAASPSYALLLAGGTGLLGTVTFLVLVRRRAPAVVSARALARSPGALRSAVVRTVALASGCCGAAFGMVEVGMPAFAEATGHSRAQAGFPLALYAVGSMLGGLVAGGRLAQVELTRRAQVLSVVLAVATAAILVPDSLGLVAVAVLVAGLPVAPALAATYQLIDRFALPGTQTEAFAWSSTALLGGFAAGSAAGGVLIGAGGAHAAWIAAVGLLAAGACAMLVGLRRHAT